jgi:glycosyltransferase involved in cell wall biosynthesis
MQFMAQQPSHSPLVSTVVPVFNGVATLPETVLSLLAQSYSHHEIILVDDGSTDSSRELMAELASDERIRVVHKENGGVADARNAGISESRGELIAFCDQDDLWRPEKLERQVPMFDRTNIALVYSGIEFRYPSRIRTSLPQGDPVTFPEILLRNSLSCCTVVATREALLHVGCFDGDRLLMGVDDWHLWIRVLRYYEAAHVTDVLATHIIHDQNYSTREDRMLTASLTCLDKVAKELTLSEEEASILGRGRREIFDHFGRNFLSIGDYRAAADCFGSAWQLNRRNLRAALLNALLTATPATVLDRAKKIKRRLLSPKQATR